MKSELKFTAFSLEKSINELLYDISLWTSELKFIKIELIFLKTLLKTYPFESKTLNLFEHIQLFIADLNNFEKNRNLLLNEMHFHKKNLNKELKSANVNYNNLGKELFSYLESYKNFKAKLYQFIEGLIK